MLTLVVIGCCIVLPFIVAGLAVLVGRISGSRIEHPSAPPLRSADREGFRRGGGQP